ncbi:MULTISPECIES: acyl carrier protein [unclassified Mycobacterium]|uniref:acyl carrier protein n=1 Tax=unclassified Mycobacterium TaxID=2642494 RepID=UPI0009926919|nr:MULTISPECIES: acyl carrier protein [unclassified Mycobacterium]
MDLPAADSVGAELIAILRDELHVDTSRITGESRLVNDVGLDSVAFAVGLVAIEDKLGVALSEEELLSAHTFGDLERTITAKLPAAQPNS